MNKKRMIAGFITAIVLVASIVILPHAVNAEEIRDGEIIYDSSYAMSEYWTEGGQNNKVPIKEDHVFGGWYEKVDSKWKAIDKDNINEASDTAYAKFVPAYVLSIQTQMEGAAAKANGIVSGKDSTYIRMVSTVDCLDYESTGYDIWYGNTTQADLNPTTVVYKELYADGVKCEPETSFGEASHYFNYLRINNIKESSLNSIIFVRPYWVTKDGTKVEGLGKYVRTSDGFSKNEYMNVPINLLDGKAVAAGMVEMKYDANTLEVVGIDAGRILPEMNYHIDEKKGVIRLVANAKDYGTEDILNDILANIRFDVKEGATKAESYTFEVTTGDFVDWAENDVKNIWKWDYKY